MKYPQLLSKGKIGSLELNNRVVMTAMGVGLANVDGTASAEIIRFYEERAIGGAGLIISEITRINDEHGVGELRQLSVTKDEHIAALRELAKKIQQHNTKLFLQLHHPGRQTFSKLIGDKPVVAPSAIPCKFCRQETRELTTAEVQSLVQDFINGAKRAQAAGVDGIELHGAHGYLINQFLSPYTNKRTDLYGGSFENRLRFIAEIISGIRKECGAFPISVRISVDEMLGAAGINEKGIELAEGIRIAQALEKMGVDAINASCGIYETGNAVVEPASYPQGWRTYLIKAVKDAVRIPVIAVNVIRKAEFAEELLARGISDFVGIGRGLLADPNWVKKIAEGREQEIRHCISCLYCFEALSKSADIKCALNPRMARELQYPECRQNGEGRTVAIVGAGPAGLESARILAMRGFKPVIFEKAAQVGGQLQLACIPPGKEKISWLIAGMKNELDKLGGQDQVVRENNTAGIAKYKPLCGFCGNRRQTAHSSH